MQILVDLHWVVENVVNVGNLVGLVGLSVVVWAIVVQLVEAWLVVVELVVVWGFALLTHLNEVGLVESCGA